MWRRWKKMQEEKREGERKEIGKRRRRGIERRGKKGRQRGTWKANGAEVQGEMGWRLQGSRWVAASSTSSSRSLFPPCLGNIFPETVFPSACPYQWVERVQCSISILLKVTWMNLPLHQKIQLVFRHVCYSFLSSLPLSPRLQCVFSSGTAVIYIL